MAKSFITRAVKTFGYTGLFLLTVFQSYLIGLVFSGIPLSLVLAVWSIIKPLSEIILNQMWAVYLICGIPFGVVVFIYIAVDVVKSRLKKDNKQDNGNH